MRLTIYFHAEIIIYREAVGAATILTNFVKAHAVIVIIHDTDNVIHKQHFIPKVDLEKLVTWREEVFAGYFGIRIFLSNISAINQLFVAFDSIFTKDFEHCRFFYSRGEFFANELTTGVNIVRHYAGDVVTFDCSPKVNNFPNGTICQPIVRVDDRIDFGPASGVSRIPGACHAFIFLIDIFDVDESLGNKALDNFASVIF